MSFTPEKRDRAEALRRKYRILFAGIRRPDDWPADHKETFTAIQDLGNRTYDSYAIDTENTAANEPWKLEIKDLATQLTERVARCARRNEASWRFACEPLVFARLSAEVSCRECRKRIWRSELEASKIEDSGSARALKRRQSNREPCRCPQYRRQDIHEAIGLNPIFTHREDEKIIHDPDLRKEISKEEQPDRVYGLRQTRNFESALYDTAKDRSRGQDTLVRDLLKESPLSEDGDPLLFPFLVHEAKSGKSDYDWYSIKLQTAFPIRTFLDVQQSLRSATGLNSKWKSGPLVWFFMNKGEDWRLCAAYMQEEPVVNGSNGVVVYRIMDLWAGSVLSRDGALQLFLIVGYICDWARDVYRESVLTELRILSTGTDDTPSVYADSDIFSTAESNFPETYISGEESAEGLSEAFNAFIALDSSYGMVRHAAFFESRFCTLFITKDNVQTLLNLTDETVIKSFSRQILTQLSIDSVFLDVDTLDAIEEKWTGNARCSRSFNLAQAKFYTIVLYSTYLSPSWQQVREIYIIAVADDAFNTLVRASNLTPGRSKALKPPQFSMDKQHMLDQVSRLQSIPIHDRLLGAIQRISVRINKLGFQEDSSSTRDIVHYVYSSFKRGRVEPSEAFLRCSKRFEQEHEQKGGAEPQICLSKCLEVSASGSVLIYGQGSYKEGRKLSERSNICLYFVEDIPKAPSPERLKTALKDAFEKYDVYHTTRNNGTSNIKNATSRFSAPWNLSQTYGVYTFGTEFIEWYRNIGLDPPTRQGSPRDSSGSGQYLLSRNIDPIIDPWKLKERFQSAMQKEFVLYKIFTREMRYWRRIARKRLKQGIECCSACAEEGSFESGLCLVCLNGITSPKYPRWIADALGGKDRPLWTPLSNFRSAYDSDDESNSMRDEIYKEISRYPHLNVPSRDIYDIHCQYKDYVTYKMYPGTRTPSTINNEENTNDDTQQHKDGDNDRNKRRKISSVEDDDVQFIRSLPIVKKD